MKEAELRKTVLAFEESKRNFESKMMSMELDAAMARVDHVVQMNAMMRATTESLKAQDVPKRPLLASRSMLDDKAPIKVMKRATSVQVENSLHNFCGAIQQMGLLEIAEGGAVGAKQDDEDRVYRVIVRWIGDDEKGVACEIDTWSVSTSSQPALPASHQHDQIRLYFSQIKLFLF